MPIAIVIWNMAEPNIPVRPNCISSLLFKNTAFMFEAYKPTLPPNAKSVDPANLSEIWYLVLN